MKSHAFLLGAVVSLVSAAAFAADDQKYWEDRDANPATLTPEEQKEKDQAELAAAQAAAEDACPPEPAATPAPAPAPATAEPTLMPAAEPAAKQSQRPSHLVSKIGINAGAGGGFGGFINDAASSQTTLQGQWDVRMVFGSRTHFAGEAAYLGNAQGVETLGVTSGAQLVGNGLEGAFRFNILTGDWQPYAVAGIGWMNYQMYNAVITTADIDATGNVATFPLGGGLAWRKNGLVLDGRISFHPATRSDVLRNTNMSTWDMNARAGFEF